MLNLVRCQLANRLSTIKINWAPFTPKQEERERERDGVSFFARRLRGSVCRLTVHRRRQGHQRQTQWVASIQRTSSRISTISQSYGTGIVSAIRRSRRKRGSNYRKSTGRQVSNDFQSLFRLCKWNQHTRAHTHRPTQYTCTMYT